VQTSEGYARQLDAMVDAAKRWVEGHPGLRLQFNFPPRGMLIMAALSESWIEAIGDDADSREFLRALNASIGGAATVLMAFAVVDSLHAAIADYAKRTSDSDDKSG